MRPSADGQPGRSIGWWVLATIILFVVLGLVDGAVLAPMQGLEAFDPTAGQPISLIASLGLLVPNLAVAARTPA